MKENVFGSLRLFLALTVLLGLGYPALVWAIGRVTFRDKADGPRPEGKRDRRSSSSDSRSYARTFSRPALRSRQWLRSDVDWRTNLGPTSKSSRLRQGRRDLREKRRGCRHIRPGRRRHVFRLGPRSHISPEYARFRFPAFPGDEDSRGRPRRARAGTPTGASSPLWREPVNVLALNMAIDAKTGIPRSPRRRPRRRFRPRRPAPASTP